MIILYVLLSLTWQIATAKTVPHTRQAQSILASHLNVYPDKPRVTFDAQGRFKLTVFSDLHYAEGEDLQWGPEQDANSTRVMREVLRNARPDYVVINGDLITGDNTLAGNSSDYVDLLLTPLIETRVPFSCTYGNHDNAANITHLLELEREHSIADLSYTRRAPPGIGGFGGEINYWVPVYAHEKDFAPALVLWFFDSRSGISPGDNPTTLPDWVDESVAGWIEQETALMDNAWGSSITSGRQALAFVHIPPSVMQSLQKTLNSTEQPGLNADNLGQGSAQATQNSADSGKDLPWWNAVTKNIKNLHAIVHGHDHGNEWCARDPQTSTILCFDKHTGYGGYSNDGWGYGVRTFELSLPSSSNVANPRPPPARTYIRMEGGSTHADVLLDEHYAAT